MTEEMNCDNCKNLIVPNETVWLRDCGHIICLNCHSTAPLGDSACYEHKFCAFCVNEDNNIRDSYQSQIFLASLKINQ